MSLLDQVDTPAVSVVSVPIPSIAAAMERIRLAGFTIQLQPGDKLLITPRSKLTEAQVAWITANKPAILAYLRSLPDDAVTNLQQQFGASVQFITLGQPEPSQAKVETGSVMVRCLDCQHGKQALPGDELGAWRLCEAGYGGYFALRKKICDRFEAKRKAA